MKSKKINRFTNRYTLSKTLQFQLLPIGKTEENFEEKQLLKEDDKRSANYKAVKKIIDDYHKHYINSKLAEVKKIDIAGYADLYYKANKDLNDKKAMKQLEDRLRKIITDTLIKDDIYAKLFKKELFSEILPEYFDKDQSKKQLITEFKNWTTYFQGFFENRNNLYTTEEKSTAIAYRCINDNLPKFLDNCRSYKIIKEKIPQSDLETIDDDYYSLAGAHLDEVFDIAYFSHVLSQNGIEQYNNIIGGYINSDQTFAKVKGLNEIINLIEKIEFRDLKCYSSRY